MATAHVLRISRDALEPGGRVALAGAPRVLYLVSGAARLDPGDALAPERAWHGDGARVAVAGDPGATVLRWELLRAGDDGRDDARSVRLLEHPIELDPGRAWLMRCDRVDFEPGGVAWPHRHQGGGIRCLLTGTLEVTIGDGPARVVRPGGAWFESGREPVLARASATEPTSFVRVSILPREIRGQSSILYVDPRDAARGRPRRYTVWVDEPIDLP